MKKIGVLLLLGLVVIMISGCVPRFSALRQALGRFGKTVQKTTTTMKQKRNLTTTTIRTTTSVETVATNLETWGISLSESTSEAPSLQVTVEATVVTPEAYLPFSQEASVADATVVTLEAVASNQQKRFRFEVGMVGGLLSSATGLGGEFRFPLPYIIGPTTTALRTSLGYYQSEDSSRRYVPLQVDAVFYFPPGWFTGVHNYLGVGLNYIVLTTGRTSGTIGGQVFYGVESPGFGGKLFAEMGYGYLRTGFSAAQKGTTLLIGFRKGFSF